MTRTFSLTTKGSSLLSHGLESLSKDSKIARLQRKCACGGTPGPSGECEECKRKRLKFQPKLRINQPGDKYEQEADHVAEAVVSGAASNRPSISSLGSGNAVQGEEPAQPSLSPSTAGNFPSIVREILRCPGQPLDAATRGLLEPRFGHDFGQVRVHNTSRAAESARAADALAYTIGNHVVFGHGQYQPATHSGRKLLAHELTHYLQQNFSAVGTAFQRPGSKYPTSSSSWLRLSHHAWHARRIDDFRARPNREAGPPRRHGVSAN